METVPTKSDLKEMSAGDLKRLWHTLNECIQMGGSFHGANPRHIRDEVQAEWHDREEVYTNNLPYQIVPQWCNTPTLEAMYDYLWTKIENYDEDDIEDLDLLEERLDHIAFELSGRPDSAK